METKYQTSFIPKKPVTATGPNRSGGMSLFLLVSIIIFLVSLGLAGYVFIEKQYLINSILANQKTIEDNKGSLVSESNTIQDFVNLDSRISVANTLLAEHVSVSPIFDFFQKTTLTAVSFKSFTFSSATKDASGASKVSVQLSGKAPDWETVALQADEFGKPEYKTIISEPKISNLIINSDSSITFTFTCFVSSDFLVYGNNTTTNN